MLWIKIICIDAPVLGCLDVTLKCFGFHGCSVTSAEEEKARRTKEEALQDPQRPFGRSTGGLLRGCAGEEGTALALAGQRARTSELQPRGHWPYTPLQPRLLNGSKVLTGGFILLEFLYFEWSKFLITHIHPILASMLVDNGLKGLDFVSFTQDSA